MRLERDALFVGLDVGTGGVRVLAVDAAGALVAQAMVEHPLLTPRPGWTEQNPDDWWAGAVGALTAVTGQLGARARQIAAVGLTGQMHGSVFLDRTGAVIRPALLWNDQRTADQCREITGRLGEDGLLRLTGNVALTGFTAPKILWLRAHEPEQYARLAKVVLPKDYIRYRLTGALATDVADASGTLLLDVVQRRWSREMLGALDLPASLVPDLFEGPEVTGRVTAEAARATGLPAGIPVVAGGGDQAAGAVGLGVVSGGQLFCSVGTSGVVFAACAEPKIHPQGRLHAFCHAVPGTWHVMGVMLAAGGSLRWLRDALYPGAGYEAITSEAAGIPAGAEGLVFLPYVTGERTPYADPHARGAFVGLGLQHRRAHIARATLEGIALGLTDCLDLVRGLGVAVPRARIAGGGARSPLWRQIIAACFDLPLERMALDEGPAFGAAVLAAVGAGAFADVPAACAAMVRVEAPPELPDPALAAVYRDWHRVFTASYQFLKPVFPRLLAG